MTRRSECRATRAGPPGGASRAPPGDRDYFTRSSAPRSANPSTSRRTRSASRPVAAAASTSRSDRCPSASRSASSWVRVMPKGASP